MTNYVNIIGLLAFIFYAGGILCALNALLYSRSAQGAIAWCLSLIFCPYIAIPLYFVFGRKSFKGYVELRKELRKNLLKFEDNLPNQKNDSLLQTQKITDDLSLRTFEQLAERGWTAGNEVKLLQTSTETFEGIFQAINDAKQYVYVQYYTIEDDKLGKRFKETLISAKKRGVKCYVLFDGIGSSNLSDSFVSELAENGVEICSFNTTIGFFNFFQLNFRNHRKIVVTDGTLAIVGSSNISDDYLGNNPELGEWRDLQIQIRGPEVLFIQKSFLIDWHWATLSIPLINTEVDSFENGSALLTVPTGPLEDKSSCALFFQNAINASTEKLWISTPYFVPDNSIIESLKLASLRGVDVRILIPYKKDNLLTWLASFYFVELLQPYSIKVFRYTEGFLHEKCFLVDKKFCSIGTANLDNRSCYLNFETSIVCTDPLVCRDIENRYLDSFSKSIEVSNVRFETLPLFKRLGSHIARLLAPVL